MGEEPESDGVRLGRLLEAVDTLKKGQDLLFHEIRVTAVETRSLRAEWIISLDVLKKEWESRFAKMERGMSSAGNGEGFDWKKKKATGTSAIVLAVLAGVAVILYVIGKT